jgi:N4-(beta-N-acetylglucosaminyl)-L-asparaginase
MHVPCRLDKDCQPNFRRNVRPDAAKSCGPYKPARGLGASAAAAAPPEREVCELPGMRCVEAARRRRWVSEGNHDTIAMVAVDADGNVAAGASSNGANHKVGGRRSRDRPSVAKSRIRVALRSLGVQDLGGHLEAAGQ